jgi:3'-phosphoadenosine 5'-phosphosulfate sulfotransferase (PAPS reductase)/FAD synthetase
MVDLIHRIDVDNKVTYVWFDTGVEYRATKNHLKYLEDKYGITIQRERAVKSIVTCTREYGQPFLSKYVSDMMYRLQRVGFQWEYEPFEVLNERYPKTKLALKWWCNRNKESFIKRDQANDNNSPSSYDINRIIYLKEFIMQNPPTFNISYACCKWAKKKVAERCINGGGYDLQIVGVRKSEGGLRATVYKNCYSQYEDAVDMYRPLFWWKNEDKEEYERAFGIVHSDCYTKYGFKRTGCACCPYGRELEDELHALNVYEPNLYKAATAIFKDSYAYTREYRKFVNRMKDKEMGRKSLFKL